MTAYELKKEQHKHLLDQVDDFLQSRLSPTSEVQSARRYQRRAVLARYYAKKSDKRNGK